MNLRRNPASVLNLLVILVLALSLFQTQTALATTLCVNPGGTDGCQSSIQAAIDAASADDTINVYPGNYDETAANRTLLAGTSVAQGPHQFGLFFPSTKPGLNLIGVDSSGNPITDPNSASLPYITTHATNNFGPSSVWVEADDVTIQGFHFGPNANGENKTIEVVADGFTLKYSNFSIPDGGAVYFGDWLYDAGTATSKIESYIIDHNVFDDGTQIAVSNGAGFSGDNSGRLITNNTFATDLLHFDWYQDNLRSSYPSLRIPGPMPWPPTIAKANSMRAICYVQYSESAGLNCSQSLLIP